MNTLKNINVNATINEGIPKSNHLIHSAFTMFLYYSLIPYPLLVRLVKGQELFIPELALGILFLFFYSIMNKQLLDYKIKTLCFFIKQELINIPNHYSIDKTINTTFILKNLFGIKNSNQ